VLSLHGKRVGVILSAATSTPQVTRDVLEADR